MTFNNRQGKDYEKMAESEFMRVVEETRYLLAHNSEWRGRYAEYAEKIRSRIPLIASVRSSFREWSPLKVYLNTTSAKEARNAVRFELRYLGQTVAELKGDKDKVYRLSTRGYDKTNLRDFRCGVSLLAADWRAEGSAAFRRFFKDRRGPRASGVSKGNDEHRLESLLLTEFSKTRRENKPLLGIQPVTVAKVRFPMPTPISASNPKTIRYSGARGGSIDILARTGTGGRATNLSVVELKIKNRRGAPKVAMKQAIAYATFIRELLRSEAGSAWWSLFGFGGKMPDELNLYAACAMPSNENNDCSFGRMELNTQADTITLHHVYFHDETDRIRIEPGDATLGVI